MYIDTSQQVISQEAVSTIARWWSDQLRQPWQGSGDEQDVEWQKLKELAKTLNHEIFDILAPTEERIAEFEATIIKELPAYLAESGDWRQYIGVDYQPDVFLRTVCLVTGIDARALPMKSGTQVKDGKVLAERGYDGVWTVIGEA